MPIVWLVVSVTAIPFVSPALAQNNVAQADTQRELLRTPKRILETEKTRREAEEQRGVLPTRKVTLADVLANPDDIELNLAYAQNQIASGNVLGASATFERILLINPDHAQARLLYAITLFRLDNLQEAERELTIVSKLVLPASVRSQVEYYIEQIKLGRKTTRYALTVSAGGQYDWNKNSAPSSNQFLVSDLLASVDDGDRRTHDYAYNALMRLEVDHDLGYQACHLLKGAVSHYRADQRFRKELDLQLSGAEIGLLYDAAPFELIPMAYALRLTLANDHYADNFGAKLRGNYQYDGGTQFYGLGRFEK